MSTVIHKTGYFVLDKITAIGQAGAMLVSGLIPRRRGFWSLLVREIYFLGVLSVSIILLSAFSIGAVLAVQFNALASRFAAEEVIGVGLALTLLRELSPVVAALLFVGRAGSAMTAEIGHMKTTEQLDAMEMMGVDVLRRVVAPRFWAGMICMPVLCVIFSVIGIFGGAQISIDWIGIDEGQFWSRMQEAVSFREDVLNGLIKSLTFAALVTWIAIFQGYSCEPTARGISKATTTTVVHGSVVILVADFFLTLVMFGNLS